MLGREKVLQKAEMLFLKGPCTNLLTHKLTCSKLQHKDSSLKNAKDIWEGSKLT